MYREDKIKAMNTKHIEKIKKITVKNLYLK